MPLKVTNIRVMNHSALNWALVIKQELRNDLPYQVDGNQIRGFPRIKRKHGRERAFQSIESSLRDEHETNEPFTIPREAIDLARRRSAITAYKEENGIDGQIPNGRSTGWGHSRGRLIDRELIKRRRRNDEEAPRSPRSIRPVSRIGGAPLLRDGEKAEIIRHSTGDRKDERWPGINTGLSPLPLSPFCSPE